MERVQVDIDGSNGSASPNLATKIEVVDDSRRFAIRLYRSILRIAPGRIRDLRVEVHGETVLLQGRCGSFYCKQVAQQTVMELARSKTVDNRIEVG